MSEQRAKLPIRGVSGVDLWQRSYGYLALFLGVMTLVIAGHAAAADYKLGPLDKLVIRVVDWPSGATTFREWPALNGEFTVGMSGTISLPFAGEVQAQGRTTQSVATTISTNIKNKLGLIEAPATSVEVLEFRPIFVAGTVQSPGRYPFDPEMTVLKAISLAGGMRQSTRGDQRFERDFLNAKGGHDVLAAERQRLLVQVARLETELANEDAAFDSRIDKEAGSQPELQDLIAQEKVLMQSRKESLSLHRSSLEEAKVLYQNEVASLAKKKDSQAREMELINTELERAGKLAEQGLLVSSRVLGLELTASDTESKLLDIDTATVRAKQEISKIASDLIDLDNNHKTEVIAELQRSNAALTENELKLKMYAGLMLEALTNAPAAGAIAGSTSDVLYEYKILRTDDGVTDEIAASENTQLRPGDLVKVTLNGVKLQLEN
ncbi:polysaccharide biosynthesis/export family protein [Agrobacterium sp. ES01]|uniref:polysaccharide biosynthesis/export family protein n=1 Tax=Agrobacterium sp. ES01 TaxID=3420714 RepID=UPI003D0BE2CC